MKLPNFKGCNESYAYLSPMCWILPIIYLVIIFIVVKRVTKLNNFLSGAIVFGLVKLALYLKNRPKSVSPPTSTIIPNDGTYPESFYDTSLQQPQ